MWFVIHAFIIAEVLQLLLSAVCAELSSLFFGVSQCCSIADSNSNIWLFITHLYKYDIFSVTVGSKVMRQNILRHCQNYPAFRGGFRGGRAGRSHKRNLKFHEK
jgi:hypothetical protein